MRRICASVILLPLAIAAGGGCNAKPPAESKPTASSTGVRQRPEAVADQKSAGGADTTKSASAPDRSSARPPSSSETRPTAGDSVARRNPQQPFSFAEAAQGGYQSDGSSGGSTAMLGTADAGKLRASVTDQIVAEVRDSLKIGKTLVVWIIDRTSASSVRSDAASVLSALQRGADPSGNALLGAVATYSDQTAFLVKEPTDKLDQVRSSLDSLSDSGSAARTFSAVKQAVDEYAPYAAKGSHVMFLLASGRGGDDPEQLDAALAALKKADIPVFILGSTTPFSQQAAQKARGGKTAPDSLAWERIDLAYPGNQNDADLGDSGFGPWGLGRLAKESGGRFFGVHTMTGGSSGAFDAGYFRKYAPDYVSMDKYNSALDANAAKRAVVEAAKLSRVRVLEFSSERRFRKGMNEAQFSKSITEAQKLPATIEDGIERMYEILSAGEADRAKLTEPRWQANFDLAMGRILAARARVQGFNSSLALLKGRGLTKPNATGWAIRPAASTTLTSAVDSMVRKAHMYLERVVSEHPNTPWAISARREMEGAGKNMGWEIVEE